MPLKVAFLVASGTGLGVIGRELARNSPTAFWILTVGVLAVACITGVVMLVQRLMRREQSRRFAKVIAPGKVAGGGTAQVRAQREDLRRHFVEGVSKLRDRGIDSYELPWYVVVGESGGGKTELLRRCGAAGSTSHGMTDPLQGVGGTLNMNWWFYNRAVILDTAGRLWEDRDNATSLSEWEEFLRLLVRYRRATPINGLILVIPATSLLRDRADALEAKTATIVDQLHRVRNALEVRFPVYVVVSKCDLIPGFRDFFEHIVQPDLQHQILGWSNRHDIDQPLQLDAPVEEGRDTAGPRETQLAHELNRLADQLEVRRLALLRDPTPSGPSGRRLDDVDGVFAFPEQFRRHIIPALSQYVTKVFAAGRYDRKPLFLRGIYLTSSMREGSPLDEDLARMLGKELDEFAAAEGTPREERAYFLTDLFDQKIFREPGLVSRSITPRRQFRRYRAALVGCALAGLVALFTLTLLASRRFAAGLGDDLALWRVAATSCVASARGGAAEHPDLLAVKPAAAASSDYVYAGDVDVGPPAKTRLTISAYHRKLHDTLGHEIRVPYVLRPFVKPGALDAVRRESQSILFHQKVVVPLVTATRTRLLNAGRELPVAGPVPAGLREATALLLRLELSQPVSRTGETAPVGVPFSARDLEALMAFVLVEGTDSWRRYAEKDPSRQDLSALFEQHMGQDALWTGLRLGLKTDGGQLVGNQAIVAGVDALLGEYCTPQALRESDPSLKAYAELAALVSAWEEAERVLAAVPQGLGPEREDWLQAVAPESVPAVQTRWREAHEALLAKQAAVETLLGRLAGPPSEDMAQEYETAVKAAVAKARARVVEQLRRDLSLSTEPTRDPRLEAFVQWLEKRTEARFADSATPFADKALTTSLQALGTGYLARVPLVAPAGAGDSIQRLAQALGERPALFRLRAALYAEPARFHTPPGGPGAPAAAAGDSADALPVVAWLGAAAPQAYRAKEAAQAARTMIELAVAYRNTVAAQQALATLPQSVDDVSATVSQQTQRALAKPTIPFTALQGGTFDPRFTPAQAKAVLTEWQARREALRGLTPLLQRQAILDSLARADGYHDQYVVPFADYWLRDVPQGWVATPFSDWRGAQRAASTAKAWAVCSGFEDACSKILEVREAGLIERTQDDQTKQRWQALLQEVEEVRRNVVSRTFVDQCDAVLRRWAQLPEDPEPARRILLALKVADFEREYFVFAPGSSGTFLQRYWTALASSLLTTLARDSRQAIEPLIAAMARYQRWPLNHPTVGPPLTLDEINASRALLQKLAAQPGDYPEGSMGMGSSVADPVLDRLIKELRLMPLPEGEDLWLERATAVARLVPANLRLQRSCKAQFAAARPGDAYPFGRFWTWVVVRQGGKEITQLNTADTAAGFELSWHPGEALQLAFFLYPNDTEPDRVLTVEGPWAPLKLLFEHQAQSRTVLERAYGPGRPNVDGSSETARATAKWLVPIVFTDPEGHRREIGLQLVFDQAIPVDWPLK